MHVSRVRRARSRSSSGTTVAKATWTAFKTPGMRRTPPRACEMSGRRVDHFTESPNERTANLARRTSASLREQQQRVRRGAVHANLEIEHGRAIAPRPHGGNTLAGADGIALPHTYS